jgi:hypothetical protein
VSSLIEFSSPLSLEEEEEEEEEEDKEEKQEEGEEEEEILDFKYSNYEDEECVLGDFCRLSADERRKKQAELPIIDDSGVTNERHEHQKKRFEEKDSSSSNSNPKRKGHYWRAPRKSRDSIIKKLPCGGLLLELAPWTWRRQPLLHYHLTGDPAQAKMLFELGYEDAKAHMSDLLKFFKRCKEPMKTQASN